MIPIDRDPDPRPTIYVASKTHRRARFIEWRARGLRIISSWIDQPDVLDREKFRDLWLQCTAEAARASMLVIVAEEGDTLKGCLIEAGAALANDRIVYQIGDCASLRAGEGSDASFTAHPFWVRAASIEQAMEHYERHFGRSRRYPDTGQDPNDDGGPPPLRVVK